LIPSRARVENVAVRRDIVSWLRKRVAKLKEMNKKDIHDGLESLETVSIALSL